MCPRLRGGDGFQDRVNFRIASMSDLACHRPPAIGKVGHC
ncbi:hypothetical protein BN2497_1773 [Janthinobacterium sp. CG23_2]|nr:hypothetical protein BN2497_1773 [Janthinobacterium sp. CG23_2]CUU27284.1 hypothetical protein BN3177_1773 [Janthinobacterium sp. CG23_2]